MSMKAKVLEGKVAVVTGAGRGIGRSIAIGLARAGAKVVIASRNQQQLEEALASDDSLHRNGIAIATDITSEESVARLAAHTIQQYGRVDILVNNSGVLATRPLLEQSAEEWDSIYATNVRGTFLVTRELGKHMLAQQSGKVINIASNFAMKGIANHTAYCGSKAAIVAITKSLALEWARFNVQVNALAPGYFATDLTRSVRDNQAAYDSIIKSVPARRMGEPDELVPWVVLLSGDASNFMTGETIIIDGGQSAR